MIIYVDFKKQRIAPVGRARSAHQIFRDNNSAACDNVLFILVAFFFGKINKRPNRPVEKIIGTTNSLFLFFYMPQ
jgi:hypothetical protein